MLACAALGGCALLPSGSAGSNGKASNGGPAAAPSVPAVELVVEAPEALKRLLQTHLDLARLRGMPGDEPVSDVELRRLVAATPVQARELLETEGYFAPDINVQQEAAVPPRVRVLVAPGPRARVARLQFEFQGDLERSMAAASGADAAAAQELANKVLAAWPLREGAPFRNADWTSAKSSTLAQLRAAGYATANWSGTGAQVDAGTHEARLFVIVDSGPLFRTGELVVEGVERQDLATVRQLAGFGAGTPATEALLLDYAERLQKSGLFDRVSVTIDASPELAAAVPITVRLSEQALQQATFGVGFSTNAGPRVSVEHAHRRVFGFAATARNKLEWGRSRQAWEGELSSHPGVGFYRNLVGGKIERVESSTDIVKSSRVRLGRTQDTPRVERLYFIEHEDATVRAGTLRTNAQALSINYHGVWRDLDNVLLPTTGQALSLQTGLGQARSSSAPSGPFARLQGRFTAYRPLGAAWYGQARLELGQMVVADNVNLPDTLLFRAGGDDSVRGYAFRELGPTVAGAITSGRVLFTGSLEVARPLSPKLPSLWWAAFVDAGNAAERWSELRPALGAGLGLRWRSPVGPLRVDLAYGERVQRWRLHLSVGITL